MALGNCLLSKPVQMCTNKHKTATRIYLTILRLKDVDIEEKLPDYGTSIRVFGLIKFKTRKGLSETESAIF